jgi:hypothetical protein
MLTSKGGLAAAEVAYYIPVILLTIYIIARKGFAIAWFFLLILCILRLAGGSILVYMETHDDYKLALLVIATTFSSVGTMPMLLSEVGLLGVITKHIGRYSLPKIVHWVVRIKVVASIACAIPGGINLFANGQEKSGRPLFGAAVIRLLIVYISLVGLDIYYLINRRWIPHDLKWHLWPPTLCIPFLLVRITLMVCVGFTKQETSGFYVKNIDTLIKAFMGFFMECFIVALYLAAGIVTPKLPKKPMRQNSEEAKDGQNGETVEASKMNGPDVRASQSHRSAWDYRPSKLIWDAISKLRGNH